MPERIPELDRLAAESERVDMLPAAEIRRRGSRRRATRQVAASVVVAALLLTAGVGIWQSPLLDRITNPQWATTAVPETPSPTSSEEPSLDPIEQPTPAPTTVAPTAAAVTPPTWDNAPTAEMFSPPEAPDVIKDQYEGMGQAAKGLCDTGSYGEPTVILTRAMGAAPEEYGSYLDATVFGYPTAEQATATFDLLKDAALNCAEAMETRANLTGPRVHDATAEVPFDATGVEAQPTRMAYVTYSGLIPDSDSGLFGETLLLQAGERLLWVTTTIEGQDFNCSPGPGDPDMTQCQVPAGIPEALAQLTGP